MISMVRVRIVGLVLDFDQHHARQSNRLCVMGCGASASSVAEVEEDADPFAPPVVEVVDEDDLLAEEVPVDKANIPDYWVNKNIGDDTQGFDSMIYVHSDNFPVFDEILEKTYMPRVTQDRPCPTGIHDRSRGGCACVQPGADPGLPVKYRTRQVIRVEDSGMWSRYIDKVQSIKEARRGEKFHLFKPPVLSNQITTKSLDLFAPLEKNLNEVYLFHGTRVRYALSIAQDDFRIDLAGSSRGTMYGPGAYLAESSTKADEYACDETGGYYEGVYALLLCRVCMGKMFYTTKRNEEAGQRIEDGSHDSTLGDRSRPPTNTFRELVVYDADQLYPEYIILYQRVHANDDEEQLEQDLSVPFHLQLPLYWKNAHKDPESNGFDEQFVVRSSMKQVMQQFVDCCGKSDLNLTVDEGALQVERIRRVENSGVWSRYVERKQEFRSSLEDVEEPLPDWPPRCSPIYTLRDMLSENDVDQLFSFADIDDRINEQLLWHGCPTNAVEWMARGVEMGREANWSMERARFSFGLLRSLVDAVPDENGVRTVLLCRVALGTAMPNYLCASPDDQKADEAIADFRDDESHSRECLLLEYESGEAPQVVISQESQVYVEYIFEITGADAIVPIVDGVLSEEAKEKRAENDEHEEAEEERVKNDEIEDNEELEDSEENED